METRTDVVRTGWQMMRLEHGVEGWGWGGVLEVVGTARSTRHPTHCGDSRQLHASGLARTLPLQHGTHAHARRPLALCTPCCSAGERARGSMCTAMLKSVGCVWPATSSSMSSGSKLGDAARVQVRYNRGDAGRPEVHG